MCLFPATKNIIHCIDPKRQQCMISEAVTPFCAFPGESGEESVVCGRSEGVEGPRPLRRWPNKRTRSRSFWGAGGSHAMAITVQQSNKGGAAAEDERTRTAGQEGFLGRSRGKRGRASAGTTRTPRGRRCRLHLRAERRCRHRVTSSR